MNRGSAVSALILTVALAACASRGDNTSQTARDLARPESPLDCTNPGILARLRCKRRHGAGWSATVPLFVSYRSTLGPRYRPMALRYIINGKTAYSWQRAFRDTQPPQTVRAAPVGAIGDRRSHTLRVALTYRGHGHGMFRYLRTYRMHIDVSLSLRAERRLPLCVVVDAFERHGMRLRERLRVQLARASAEECRRLAASAP